MSDRYYGISKGSKAFPFITVYQDPDALTLDQAQLDYDFLLKRRDKIVRAIARDIRENDITRQEDLTDELLSCREQVTNIDAHIANLIEYFPEVQR